MKSGMTEIEENTSDLSLCWWYYLFGNRSTV